MKYILGLIIALAWAGIAVAQPYQPPSCVRSNGSMSCAQILAPDGSAGAPSYSFGSDPDTGIYGIAADTLGFTTGGTARALINANGLRLASVTTLEWASASLLAAVDTRIARAAAGSFTFSNASTNSFTVTAGAAGLATFGGAVNTTGNVTIPTGANFNINGAQGGRWQSGSFQQIATSWVGWSPDGIATTSNDLTLSRGGTGALIIGNAATPTNSVTLTVGASNLLTLNGGLTTGGSVTSSGVFQSNQGGGTVRYGGSGDGVALLQNAGTNNFNRIQFGGTTSSFPAIKRNGTGIDIVLANDSGFTTLAASTVRTATSYSAAGTPLPTCNAGAIGTRAHVTDAVAWTPAAAYVSGGSAFAPVICTGAAWFMN